MQTSSLNEVSANIWSFLKKNKVMYGVFLFLTLSMFPISIFLTLLTAQAWTQLSASLQALSWSSIIGQHATRWLTPYLSGTDFEQGIPVEFQTTWFPGLLFTFGSLYFLFRFAQEYFIEYLGEKIALNFRTLVCNQMLAGEVKKTVTSGLYSSIYADDTKEIRSYFTRVFGSMISDFSQSLIFLAMLAILSTELFLLLVAVLTPAIVVIRFTSKALKKFSRLGIQSQAALLDTIVEKITGWQIVKTHNSIDFESKRFDGENLQIFQSWKRAARVKAFSSSTIEWLGIIAASCVIVLSLRRIAVGSLTPSLLTAFLVVLAQLANSLQNFSTQLNSSRKGKQALQRLANYTKFTHFKKDFENTNQYQSIELEYGKLNVIVGSSGVGKSTFLKHLLLGKNENKKLSAQGKSLTITDLKVLFLTQEPYILPLSIAENALFPNQKPSSKALENAKNTLKMLGLDRNITEMAISLSGGERQKLALARVFQTDYDLIVIDEGTSALDETLEKLVLSRLSEISHSSLVLMVAHRTTYTSYAHKTFLMTNEGLSAC